MASIQQRTTADGKQSYRVQIRVKGFPPQTQTFKRKTDAKNWAEDTESRMRNGSFFPNSESKSHTVKDMIDRYLKHAAITKPKAMRDLNSQLSWWRGEIGAYALSSVSSSLIVACRDKLLQGTTVRNKPRSPSTALRYLATFSTVLTTAVKDWGWLERSPMEKVTKPKASRGRLRFLNGEERVRLLESCKESTNPYLYLVVVLAISTGMRQGEIMNIRLEDITLNSDECEGKIILHDTKNGERRTVPLSGFALDLLKTHTRSRTAEDTEKSTATTVGLIFPSLKNTGERAVPMDLRAPWETALKNANLADFRFHDLRHTTASYLAMNGSTLPEIAEILGHKTLSMVKRYAHFSESHVSKVVADMNSKIFPNTPE